MHKAVQHISRIALFFSSTLMLPLTAHSEWFIQATGGYQVPMVQTGGIIVGSAGSPPQSTMNDYTSTSINNIWGYGAGIGYRHNLQPNINLGQYVSRNEISLNYWQNDQLKIKGSENIDASQEAISNYQYLINSTAGLIEDKLFFRAGYATVQPFMVLGIGISQLNSHNYTRQTIATSDGSANFGGPYSDQQVTGLAWEAGLGVAIDLTQHLSLLMGYRYINLGTAQTGTSVRNNGAESPNGVNYTVQTNSAIVGLTAYF
jgi:opacity protein-like surface antigen